MAAAKQQNSGTPAVKDKRNADRKNGKKWAKNHGGKDVKRFDDLKIDTGMKNSDGEAIIRFGAKLPRSIVGYKRDKAADRALQLSTDNDLGYGVFDLDPNTVDGCKLIRQILADERDRKREKAAIMKATSGLRNINWTVMGRTRTAGA